MFARIIVRHARQHWPLLLLLWLALTAVASLYVYLRNSAQFTNRSMQLIMKDMGHNLLILPREADPLDTFQCTAKQVPFDERTAEQLVAHLELPGRYFVAVLQAPPPDEGPRVILTGIRPMPRADETREKGNMVPPVRPGHARLGATAAQLLNAAQGQSVTIRGQDLTVSRIMPPTGTIDDYRVYVDLALAQRMLAAPASINAVWSFLCMEGQCLADVMGQNERLLAQSFPGLKVVTNMPLAEARFRARDTTSRFLKYLLVIVLTITVVLIAVIGLQEVAERRREVGILLALGTGHSYIVGLFTAALGVISLLAAGAGFAIGSWLARQLLRDLLASNTRPVSIVWSQLPEVIALVGLVAALAQAIPMLKLVRMDPNAILVEE